MCLRLCVYVTRLKEPQVVMFGERSKRNTSASVAGFPSRSGPRFRGIAPPKMLKAGIAVKWGLRTQIWTNTCPADRARRGGNCRGTQKLPRLRTYVLSRDTFKRPKSRSFRNCELRWSRLFSDGKSFPRFPEQVRFLDPKCPLCFPPDRGSLCASAPLSVRSNLCPRSLVPKFEGWARAGNTGDEMLEQDVDTTLKVIVVGNGQVGKTSMITRFAKACDVAKPPNIMRHPNHT